MTNQRETAAATKNNGPFYLYHLSPKCGCSYGVVERWRCYLPEQAIEAVKTHLKQQAKRQTNGGKTLFNVDARPGDKFLVVDSRKLPPAKARKKLRQPLAKTYPLLARVIKVCFGTGDTLIAQPRPQYEWDANNFPYYLFYERKGAAIVPTFFKTTRAARDAVTEHLLAQAGDKKAKKLPIKFQIQRNDTFLICDRRQILPKNARGWHKAGNLGCGPDSRICVSQLPNQ